MQAHSLIEGYGPKGGASYFGYVPERKTWYSRYFREEIR